MTIKYVKHDRPVTTKQIEEYGKLATHDLHIPILVLYPNGKTKDKNGVEVNINDEFVNTTMHLSNEAIKKKFSSPFAKVKSFISEVINDYESIPIIKNHKTDDVDNLAGYTKGLFYTEQVAGKTALLIKGVLKDIETKSKIDSDLFRHVSIGTRPDGSIKEISIVSNEALPHAGFMMSEPEASTTEKTTQELQLAEEISGLQFQESLYETTIIPNHLIISRLIKTGKLAPWAYDQHIKTSTVTQLELMERTIPAKDLGLMLGTNRDPELVNRKEIEADLEANKIIKEYQKKSGKASTTDESKPELSSTYIEMIKQGHSFEERRSKELKHILELAEHSPKTAAKYIKYELGEDVAIPEYKDILLTEYISELNNIKSKLKTLQLGENDDQL